MNMVKSVVVSERGREQFLAELTDVAFRVAARHGVRGSSVDHEVDLWKALGDVVQRQPDGRERLVAELTDAAYRVTLGHGFRDSFLDVQLDLWRALCRAVRRSRFVPAADSDPPHLVPAVA
jgi:hypothetical protein